MNKLLVLPSIIPSANNAYERVLKHLVSRENLKEDTNVNDSNEADEHDDVKFTRDNFNNFNFLKEKD